MENKKIKKGDPCVIVERHNSSKGRTPMETKVTSAGSKWIYVEYFGKTNKFDAETLRSDWGGYDLFIGTREEYKRALQLEEERSKLENEITNLINKLSVGNLQKVKYLIESLTE